MSQFDRKNHERHAEDDPVLRPLDDAEQFMKRPFRGMRDFATQRIPGVFRQWAYSSSNGFEYGRQVFVRVCRLVGLGVAWLAIVLGPLALSPDVLTGSWFVFGLVGSVWGIRRYRKNQSIVISVRKDGSHA